jgi:electron transport complex protein RnfC
MSATEKLLSFRHGVHPEEYKEYTNDKVIERMPFVKEYFLPLSQHIGAPSTPLVKEGQIVKRGQKIADASGFVSVALHAPVDGTVEAVDLIDHPNGKTVPGIRIKTDPFSSQQMEVHPQEDKLADKEAFISAIQDAGIVGLGGAAFPAHVKFSIPEDKHCTHLMLNGCECEPFLTCDHRVMAEYAEELIDGTMLLQKHIRADHIHIAIEANKPDAIENLRKVIARENAPIEVVPLKVKYPQGAEKMMITAILGKEVPAGKLPLDVGVLVSNVGTIVALSQLFRKGYPLIERVVTVTGPGVKRPANVLVPIGTPMRELVEFCGGLSGEATRLLLGGPMMGMVQKSLDVPVIKGTSGILALSEKEVQPFETYNCIRCGRCLDACPLFLNPARLGAMARKGLWDDMEEYHVMDCFECGSCSYVCPSGIPLVQSFRVGKAMIREIKKKEN